MKAKSPAIVKTTVPGPSRPKTRKLTPLFVKFPICDKTSTSVSNTGTKRTIQIRNKSVPVIYSDETPEIIKRRQRDPNLSLEKIVSVGDQTRATSTPVRVGKGKAGCGLKVKSSQKAKPSSIRPPGMSNKLSVKLINVVKSTVKPVKTKTIAITGQSTVDLVIETVARGGILSDNDDQVEVTKTQITSDDDNWVPLDSPSWLYFIGR